MDCPIPDSWDCFDTVFACETCLMVFWKVFSISEGFIEGSLMFGVHCLFQCWLFSQLGGPTVCLV